MFALDVAAWKSKKENAKRKTPKRANSRNRNCYITLWSTYFTPVLTVRNTPFSRDSFGMQISALAHAASDALPTALVHDQSETAAARACAHQIADAWRFYKELKNAAMQRPTMKALGRVG